ncbi:MAG: hypothetical protein IKA36_04300 [Clostridia bacterium]|nr:hypothetical protein [Clostridia bacterium]
MKKMLGMREKIFVLISSFIVAVLCLVRFIVAFAKECNFLNFFSTKQYQLEYEEEIINFSSLNYIKVILIAIACISILLLILSFVYLFIKNENVKKGLFIVAVSLVLLGIIFFFVARFTSEDLLTKSVWLSEDENAVTFCMASDQFYKNSIYLIFCLIVIVIMHLTSFSLSNEYLKSEEDQIEDKNNDRTKNQEEITLNEEIDKLKAKIRIKDLEHEYLKLKSQLDKK